MRKLKSRYIQKGLVALTLMTLGSVAASFIEQIEAQGERTPAALRRSETIASGCRGNCAPPGYLEPVTQLQPAQAVAPVQSVPAAPRATQAFQYATPRAAPSAAPLDPAVMNSFPHQALTRLPSACNAFITRSGALGPYGQLVAREISRYDVYFSPHNRIEQICPNFHNFRSRAEKTQFWVWVYASLAAQESSCDPNQSAPPTMNPNGVAVGLLQMEKRTDLRRSRDIAYHGNYCSGNPYAPAVNIRCSARIMAGLLSKQQGLYARNRAQYWGPLQSNRNNMTKKSIAQYQACYK
jgi:hypothetical protein